MKFDLESDLRLDPRIRTILARRPQVPNSSVTNREELLAEFPTSAT